METYGYFPRYLAIVRENEAGRKQKFSPSLVFLLPKCQFKLEKC